MKNIAHPSKYCKNLKAWSRTKAGGKILRGKISEIENQIGERKLKGEITLVITGKTRKKVAERMER